jgi:hypothetical protein
LVDLRVYPRSTGRRYGGWEDVGVWCRREVGPDRRRVREIGNGWAASNTWRPVGVGRKLRRKLLGAFWRELVRELWAKDWVVRLLLKIDLVVASAEVLASLLR